MNAFGNTIIIYARKGLSYTKTYAFLFLFLQLSQFKMLKYQVKEASVKRLHTM